MYGTYLMYLFHLYTYVLYTHNTCTPLEIAECPIAQPHTPATTMGASTQPRGMPAEQPDLKYINEHTNLVHDIGYLGLNLDIL